MHHHQPTHFIGHSIHLANQLIYLLDYILARYISVQSLANYHRHIIAYETWKVDGLFFFFNFLLCLFCINQTGYSRLNYTPTSDLDYGTISCWGRNAIGVQKSPCIFQIVAAGKSFIFQFPMYYHNKNNRNTRKIMNMTRIYDYMGRLL